MFISNLKRGLKLKSDYRNLIRGLSDKSQKKTKRRLEKAVLKYVKGIYIYDEDTYYHCLRVAKNVRDYFESTRMVGDDLIDIVIGAYLHDYGKVFIDKELLNKKERLKEEEFEKIKKHTVYGYDYINPDPVIPSISKKIILLHHEYLDGTGYPTKAEDIDYRIRIISMCDKYDAIVNKRKYPPYIHEVRKNLTINDIRQILIEAAQKQDLSNNITIFLVHKYEYDMEG